LRDLRAVVERDLRDATIEGLSSDRRFATTYNAVLQLARIVVACAGYRLTGAGHHQAAFEALPIAMGSRIEELASYFDTCRRKRNQVDYDFAEAATETETEELLVQAREFQKLVEAWVHDRHPEFRAPRRRG
jgi:hypothetical protein